MSRTPLESDNPIHLGDTPAEGAGPPAPSAAHERQAAIADLLRYEAQLEQAQELRVRLSERRHRIGPRHGILAACVLVALWAWLFPPAPLRLSGPTVPSIAEEQAALELLVYLEAQRIEHHVAEQGRTPETGADAGLVRAGLDYFPLTNRHYRVRGRTDRVTWSYSSAELPADLATELSRVLDLGSLER
jgi:hypothetical protein